MLLPEALTSVLDAGIKFIYSFQPLCEKTVILVPKVLKDQVSVVADLVGMDAETVNYVLALFLCYPLGLVMLSIPYKYAQIRHLASFLMGAFLIQFTVGVQWVHLLFTSLVAYAMICTLPRSTLKIALPTFCMVYLTGGHLHRQYTNYLGWDLDFTGLQMVATQKLYMIAYNLYDGEQLQNIRQASMASKKCAPFALRRIPNIVEFLGYMFCFSNVLVGPATEYTIYLRVIDGSIMKGPDRQFKTPPSNLWPTLRPLLTSLLNMGLFLVLTTNFPLLDPTDPQRNTPAVITTEFLQKPWGYRILYCWLGLLGSRQKYYFGWKNAEGAQNIWYAGFDGFDNITEQPKGWETAVNVNILGFEFAPDIQTMSKEWNKKTSFWLSRYVYMRTNGSLLATYSMSAFWHGFYPGYYTFFLTIPLLTFCDRLAKKKLSPRFPPGKWTPYGIVGMIATSLGANYSVQGFAMLALSWTYELYKSHYFVGHIFSMIFYIFLTLLPTPKKPTDEDDAKDKKDK